MARTVTVREVLWRVCVLVQDRAPQFQRWPERELVMWLDDAQMALFKYLPLSGSRIDAIKLRPGSLQSIESIAPADCKPGDGSVPTVAVLGMQFLRLLNNMGADGLTPGSAVRMVSRDLMDAQSPDWRTVERVKVDSYMFDPDTPYFFEVTPAVPASPAVWARGAYIAQPQKIPNTGVAGAELYGYDGASNQLIGVHDENVDDLVNYICARAYMRNSQNAGDPSKVAMFSGLFLNSLNAKVTAATGNNPNLKTLPFAPQPVGQAGS